LATPDGSRGNFHGADCFTLFARTEAVYSRGREYGNKGVGRELIIDN
jgi:hypothetical protein